MPNSINSRPTIVNVAMATAGTEYSYTLPAGTKRFSIKLRNMGYPLQLCWVSGESGTTYINIPQSESYYEKDVRQGNNTLYFKTTADSQTAEIISWV